MANVCYCRVKIQCSNPEKLVKALFEKEYIEGSEEEDEEGQFEACISLDQLTTGYGGEYGMMCYDIDTKSIYFDGNSRGEGWMSQEDLEMLKDVCDENEIELQSIEINWDGECSCGAQVWPTPKWILKNDSDACEDGFACAVPNDNSIMMDSEDDEYVINGSTVSGGEMLTELAQMLQKALKTGKNPGFNKDWQKLLPNCVIYNYLIDDYSLGDDQTFDWDWTK